MKPNFRLLGKRFGKRTAAVAAAIAEQGATAFAPSAASFDVVVDGQTHPIGADEVIVTELPREGWATAAAGGETVALDLEITPELRRAGLVREVIRLVQDARKGTGLDVSDRIELWWSAADGEVATALRDGAATLAGEVLATSVTEGAPTAKLKEHGDAELGLTFWLRVAGR